MNRLLLVTVILALFSPGIQAQNYNPKFDEGPNLAEFLKTATEDSPFPCMLFPSVDETIRGVLLKDEGFPGLRRDLLKPRAGSFYPPLRPAVANNTTYDYAKKYPPQFETSQDPVAKELLIKWDDINSARGLLLDEATGLESQDSGLYAERVQLAQNANALIKEREALKAAWAAHQQGCPVPHDAACTAEHNRLVKWDQDLKQAIATHNARYNDWLKLKKGLDDSVTGWRERLKGWEDVILGFIEKVQDFLRDTGNCTLEEWKPLQQAVNDYCHGVVSSCKKWNPGDPTLDCATWKEYLARNQVCRDARNKINTTCFNGGDPGHIKAENQAIEAMFKCQDLITKHCMKSREFTMPGRKYGLGL